ncbi:MAG: hypothetical protein LH468_10005 [Nocardioides sp.]|nr:hypothetical protein [Nocardioides sp.]
MRFRAGEVIAQQPSWWLYDETNEVVAWAGETYPSLRVAEDAADDFRSGATRAKFELFQDRSSQWRWRAYAADRLVASSGEAFLSQIAARRAANLVRDNVARATPAVDDQPALRHAAP